jgi:hydroxymethylbilane synthase
MPARVVKLGTRRSALARAQSGAVARRLEILHPGLTVELIGIDTRGDRILDTPLREVQGKEFFTAEIDAALLEGAVDLTVHSYKDLSLERSAAFCLAAVPRREQPRDIVVFAPDVRARLAAGEPLRIGSSSPRRASFIPDLLHQILPGPDTGVAADRVRLVELRGNVDSRLRRLHEPRGSARQIDGVVLAFAGLARLWADESGRALLQELLVPLPRMVLPLSASPGAPAQGALAIECRAADDGTIALLQVIDHAPTRRAVAAERALLAERGGGCHQRFGATQLEIPELGALLYLREAQEQAGGLEIGPPQLRWTPATPLPAVALPVRAWDGSRAQRTPIETLEAGSARSAQRLPTARALFITHRRALPDGHAAAIPVAAHVFVPGVETWRALARLGVWIEGCAEGLGIAALEPLLGEPLLQLPALSEWLIYTHEEAAGGWSWGEVLRTYRHLPPESPDAAADGPPPDATHVYWHSSAQFERARARLTGTAHHACGPGKTFEHLRAVGVHNPRMFPSPTHWREWLRL